MHKGVISERRPVNKNIIHCRILKKDPDKYWLVRQVVKQPISKSPEYI